MFVHNMTASACNMTRNKPETSTQQQAYRRFPGLAVAVPSGSHAGPEAECSSALYGNRFPSGSQRFPRVPPLRGSPVVPTACGGFP